MTTAFSAVSLFSTFVIIIIIGFLFWSLAFLNHNQMNQIFLQVWSGYRGAALVTNRVIWGMDGQGTLGALSLSTAATAPRLLPFPQFCWCLKRPFMTKGDSNSKHLAWNKFLKVVRITGVSQNWKTPFYPVGYWKHWLRVLLPLKTIEQLLCLMNKIVL